MLIKSEDVLKSIGNKIKVARLSKKYTQEYVAENIDISTDLLRSIENGRNIGSLHTLLYICNFLHISPNKLFEDLLTFKDDTLDSTLISYIDELSGVSKDVLKKIIIHIDKNYNNI